MHGVDLHTPLSASDRDAALKAIATQVVARRLETPAVMFLEMHKPLSFVASQAVVVAVPMLGPLIGAQRMADLSKLLQDRDNIDALIELIEEMAERRDESAAQSAAQQE